MGGFGSRTVVVVCLLGLTALACSPGARKPVRTPNTAADSPGPTGAEVGDDTATRVADSPKTVAPSKRWAEIAADPEVEFALRVLETWIESKMAYDDLPGLALGIVYDGELVWFRGFGYADVEKKVPVDENTIFPIASNTKMFTAIALMTLVDEGKLRLDDQVSAHLPWFVVADADPNAQVITIRHLLTHSAGLPRDAKGSLWDDEAGFPFATREQIREAARNQEISVEPGSRWKYSNLGASLVGEIIAAVSGESYEGYVAARVFEPLAMRSTTVGFPARTAYVVAQGYGRHLPGAARRQMPHIDSRGEAACGAIYSNVSDLAKFVAWQLRLRRYAGREILKSSTLREMQRVHWLDRSWTYGMGLGFWIYHEPSGDLVGHGGWVPGFRTDMNIDADHGVGAIVLTNADDFAVYPDTPGGVSGQLFRWVVPAIAKAVEGKGGSLPATAANARYEGNYRAWTGDMTVMSRGDELVMFAPTSPNPMGGLIRLLPVGDHTYKVEDAYGGGHPGELLRFEVDRNGLATEMRVGGLVYRRIPRP